MQWLCLAVALYFILLYSLFWLLPYAIGLTVILVFITVMDILITKDEKRKK
jgi:hypothetical protein